MSDMSNQDLFAEFDQTPMPAQAVPTGGATPVGAELEAQLEAEIEAGDLDAMLLDPRVQPAQIVSPLTGLVSPGVSPPQHRQALWHSVPIPVRLKAFYLFIEYGDLVPISAALGLSLITLRNLKRKDRWLERAAEIRENMEAGLKTSWSKSKLASLGWFQQYLAQCSPDRMAAMSTPSDLANIMKGIVAIGGEPKGITVKTSGPTQLNYNAGPDRDNPDPVKTASDAELMAELQKAGISVQPPPPMSKGISAPPPPDPKTVGETDETRTKPG